MLSKAVLCRLHMINNQWTCLVHLCSVMHCWDLRTRQTLCNSTVEWMGFLSKELRPCLAACSCHIIKIFLQGQAILKASSLIFYCDFNLIECLQREQKEKNFICSTKYTRIFYVPVLHLYPDQLFPMPF